MYSLELQDIMFAVSCLHRDFDLRNFVTFSSHGTRSSRLTHRQARLTDSQGSGTHFPPIDLELSGVMLSPTFGAISQKLFISLLFVHALSAITTLTHLFLNVFSTSTVLFVCLFVVVFFSILSLSYPFLYGNTAACSTDLLSS